MQVFEQHIEVALDDLDELDHVNNVRYVEWVQEISKKHWNHTADAQMKKDMIWVVRRHDILYHKSAILGDTLRLSTYIAENKGPISTRIVEIHNNKTDQLIVKAITDWCLLNASTFKPKRVPDSVTNLFMKT
nr:acyl-ACP thioesterase domain-containing protein [Allomuricauda sp.]